MPSFTLRIFMWLRSKSEILFDTTAMALVAHDDFVLSSLLLINLVLQIFKQINDLKPFLKFLLKMQ